MKKMKKVVCALNAAAAAVAASPARAFAGREVSTNRQVITSELAGELSPSDIVQNALSSLAGVAPAIVALAAAAGSAAIVLAVVRAALFQSESTNAATVSRIIRVLAMVALISAMASIVLFAYQQLGGGQGVAGIVEVM